MEIKKCAQTDGIYLDLIPGQSRYYFGQSDTEDFYDIPGWLENGGYQGSVIHFFDLETGTKYFPFSKERNVLYGHPIFCDEFIYFLRGDFHKNLLTLYQYLPGKAPNPVFMQSLDQFDLYNLMVMGTPVHIISQSSKKLRCYYPKPFECPQAPNESLIHIEDDRLYFSAWIEEGVENDVITDHYKYYDKLIIKDYAGNILSEETGCLTHFPDGSWRLV